MLKHLTTPIALIGLFQITSSAESCSHRNSCECTASIWTSYLDARKNKTSPPLADYSYAGYHCGDKAVPMIKSRVFDVTKFGAVPNDEKSDKEAFRKAIAAASAHGGGVIFFPKGCFHIHAATDDPSLIYIQSNNIVIRGSGSHEGGTELFMEKHLPAEDPKKKWTTPFLVNFTAPGLEKRIDDNPLTPKRYKKLATVTGSCVAESHSIEVDSTKHFKKGDWVLLTRKDKHPDSIAKALSPYKPNKEWRDICQGGVQIIEHHQITAIIGNTLSFREPIHSDIKPNQGWTIHQFTPLQECGVENLAFVGNWQEKFVHHKSALHDGGWSLLKFKGVANGWIRNCRFTDVNAASFILESTHITVANTLLDGNQGHHAISFIKSSHCLGARLVDTASQWHSFGISKYASGNVFWRCEYPADTSFESHAQQPRHTLFDLHQGGFIDGRWGGAKFNQPNHLEGLVLWNYKNTSKNDPSPYEFVKTNNAYGKIIMPDVIGFHGGKVNFVRNQVRTLESNGRPVKPASLYEAQLLQRKKTLPEWLVHLKKIQ